VSELETRNVASILILRPHDLHKISTKSSQIDIHLINVVAYCGEQKVTIFRLTKKKISKKMLDSDLPWFPSVGGDHKSN